MKTKNQKFKAPLIIKSLFIFIFLLLIGCGNPNIKEEIETSLCDCSVYFPASKTMMDDGDDEDEDDDDDEDDDEDEDGNVLNIKSICENYCKNQR